MIGLISCRLFFLTVSFASIALIEPSSFASESRTSRKSGPKRQKKTTSSSYSSSFTSGSDMEKSELSQSEKLKSAGPRVSSINAVGPGTTKRFSLEKPVISSTQSSGKKHSFWAKTFRASAPQSREVTPVPTFLPPKRKHTDQAVLSTSQPANLIPLTPYYPEIVSPSSRASVSTPLPKSKPRKRKPKSFDQDSLASKWHFTAESTNPPTLSTTLPTLPLSTTLPSQNSPGIATVERPLINKNADINFEPSLELENWGENVDQLSHPLELDSSLDSNSVVHPPFEPKTSSDCLANTPSSMVWKPSNGLSDFAQWLTMAGASAKATRKSQNITSK